MAENNQREDSEISSQWYLGSSDACYTIKIKKSQFYKVRKYEEMKDVNKLKNVSINLDKVPVTIFFF